MLYFEKLVGVVNISIDLIVRYNVAVDLCLKLFSVAVFKGLPVLSYTKTIDFDLVCKWIMLFLATSYSPHQET